MVTKTTHHHFAGVYVRAWLVRLTRRPDTLPGGSQAADPPRVLSITAPSGGTGRKRKPTAPVSEHHPQPVEEACRRSHFYIAEICRGQERWRSGPLRHADVAAALGERARHYTSQGMSVKRHGNRFAVGGNGVAFEIRIRKEVA